MGKTGAIVLGAVVIGTALGIYFSTTFGLAPTGGLPILCGLAGVVASALLVSAFDLARKRRASAVSPTATEPAPKPLDDTPHEPVKP